MKKITIIFFILTLFCSKNYEEELKEIDKKAKEAIVKQNKEKIVSLLEELEELEQEYVKEKITQLNTLNEKKSIYHLTSSKKLFFFSKDDILHVYFKNQILNLNKQIPEQIFSSFSGNFILLTYKDKQNCYNEFYNFIINKEEKDLKWNFNKNYDFQDSCFPKVITDTGKIYYLKDQEIWERTVEKEVKSISQNQLNKIFKKNSHKLFLFSLPEKGIWIFYGNFGYYDLYYYNEKILKLLIKGVATPKIFYVVDELFKEDTSMNYYYFVVTGGVGEYTYTGFLLPDQIWKSFNIPYRKDYVYIMKQNHFLFSEDEFLNLYNVTTNKEIKLPIKVTSFFAYDGSLILLMDKKLLIRKEPFDSLEKKIFSLKEDLYYNIR